MIEQQLDTLIATMARCELLLARIAEQRLTFTYPPPQQMTMQELLEQRARNAVQQSMQHNAANAAAQNVEPRA